MVCAIQNLSFSQMAKQGSQQEGPWYMYTLVHYVPPLVVL